MSHHLLELEGIQMRFGGVHSLRGVSVAVPAGRIVGLIGPNGAGKTTLFNVATGLLRPQEGTVHAFGRDLRRLGPHQRARLGIGRSFQNLGLLPEESIRTNLLASQFVSAGYGVAGLALLPWIRPLRERQLWQEAQRALEQFEVAEHPDTLVRELSFGVARRVELAGLIARGSQLLLLDEPTTGLDTAETEVLMRTLTAQRASGKTVLVVAHDVSFVLDMCDEVNVLAEGSLIFSGSPQDARRDPQVIESFLGTAA